MLQTIGMTDTGSTQRERCSRARDARRWGIGLAMAAAFSGAVQAQSASPGAAAPDASTAKSANSDVLANLKQFKVSGVDASMPSIEQGGRKAEALRKNLKSIRLPPGFRIELYAIVPFARQIAVGPTTGMLFVGSRKQDVWAVTDRDSDGVADEVKRFAPSLKFQAPNGVCWSRDGMLVVTDINQVLMFPAAEFFFEGNDVPVAEVVPHGKLVPPSEESFNHSARFCRVGPDGMLYLTLGQPFNVPPREKADVYAEWGLGGIVRMKLDGTGREVFAKGIRNSVGLDFNPADKSLWFTDNQTDGMGDDIPPGELNRADRPGMHFGYPWLGGRSVRITEHGYDKDTLPDNLTPPEVEFEAHAADLGMTFYHRKAFPAHYHGGIFSAQHGSWNRTVPNGAQIMFTPVGKDGRAGKPEVFATGWLQPDEGDVTGRPVDVAVRKDGSLLVSDDYAGAIYRISYTGAAGPASGRERGSGAPTGAARR